MSIKVTRHREPESRPRGKRLKMDFAIDFEVENGRFFFANFAGFFFWPKIFQFFFSFFGGRRVRRRRGDRPPPTFWTCDLVRKIIKKKIKKKKEEETTRINAALVWTTTTTTTATTTTTTTSNDSAKAGLAACNRPLDVTEFFLPSFFFNELGFDRY